MTDVHHNEAQRLATLARLEILGESDEPALDRLVQTALLVFGAPICAVSLVGENDEWFRARGGITATTGPRKTAFCAHTVQGDEVFVVENALEDARFKDNPQVTGADGVRFYAGAPIVAADGSCIGSFCIKDRKPRQFSAREAEILANFAAMAMSEIMHRLAVKAGHAASRAKSCFLASMNHAVRTPLTSIFGFSELLAEPGVSAEERADALNSIRRNGEQLLNFIDDAMMLAELETGGVQARPRDFVLSDLLRDVQASTGAAAQAKNLRFEVQTMADVPPLLHADPVLLRHLIAQLLDNAVKFTATGSVTMLVRKAPKEGRVCIEVSDTGRGMSPEQLETLWSPLDTRNVRSTRETGMGLPIVARIASLMGGSVVVRSTPGIGSIFTLEFAARAAEEPVACERRAA